MSAHHSEEKYTTISARLGLRRLQRSDLNGFHTIWSNPNATQWTSYGVCNTLSESEKWLDVLSPSPEKPEPQTYGVFLRDTSYTKGQDSSQHILLPLLPYRPLRDQYSLQKGVPEPSSPRHSPDLAGNISMFMQCYTEGLRLYPESPPKLHGILSYYSSSESSGSKDQDDLEGRYTPEPDDIELPPRYSPEPNIDRSALRLYYNKKRSNQTDFTGGLWAEHGESSAVSRNPFTDSELFSQLPKLPQPPSPPQPPTGPALYQATIGEITKMPVPSSNHRYLFGGLGAPKAVVPRTSPAFRAREKEEAAKAFIPPPTNTNGYSTNKVDRMIGIVGVFRSTIEVGYIFNEEFWGQGYASEALRSYISIHESRVRLNPTIPQTISARVDPKNAASVKVLKKCGFRVVKRVSGNREFGEKDTAFFELHVTS